MAGRLVASLVLVGWMLAAPAAGAHEKFRFIGTVVKMDAAKKLLTMKTTDKAYPPVLEIDMTPKTRVERNGRKVTAAELKSGAYVVVDALGDDYFAVEAVLVRIVPPPAKR